MDVPVKSLHPLLSASNSSTQVKALEILIEEAKTPGGRSDLASRNILPAVLQLVQSLSYPSDRDILLSSLKLLRNLCAGEIRNQNSFIEQNSFGIVSSVLSSVGFEYDSDYGIIRMGLQLLGNVSLAGEEHQHAVWRQFFPNEFLKMSRIRRRETCDPLCMVIYTCSDGSHERFAELCGEKGLHIIAEMVQTASEVGFGEDWFQLLLSRICLDECHFPQLFTLCPVDASKDDEFIEFKHEHFASEQAFLLKIVSEILNERIREITVYKDFALCAFGIFKRAVGFVDFVSRGSSSLPTGSTVIDVLGYSLTIIRDICALDGLEGSEEGSVGVVDSLLSSGLLEMLMSTSRSRASSYS